MQDIDEQRIRERAYDIWEREGRPEGREQDHWEQARLELMREAGRSGPDRDPEPASRAEALWAPPAGGAPMAGSGGMPPEGPRPATADAAVNAEGGSPPVSTPMTEEARLGSGRGAGRRTAIPGVVKKAGSGRTGAPTRGGGTGVAGAAARSGGSGSEAPAARHPADGNAAAAGGKRSARRAKAPEHEQG